MMIASSRGGKAKHGVCTVAVVMVAMTRTCDRQLRCGSAFLDLRIMVRFALNV